MRTKQLLNMLIGLIVFTQHVESRNERGLSQSAENAILLAGAVAVASIVIAAITAYVTKHMPK